MDSQITYESASEELDRIIEDLDSDQITIDALAQKVERAGVLLKFCTEKLRTTEQKVKEIIADINL